VHKPMCCKGVSDLCAHDKRLAHAKKWHRTAAKEQRLCGAQSLQSRTVAANQHCECVDSELRRVTHQQLRTPKAKGRARDVLAHEWQQPGARLKGAPVGACSTQACASVCAHIACECTLIVHASEHSACKRECACRCAFLVTCL